MNDAESKAPAAEAEPAAVGGTEVQLHFGEEINLPTLRKTLEKELEEAKLPLVPFDLSNPKFVSQSMKGFHDWKLSIALSPAQTETLLKQMQVKLASTPVFPSSSNIGGKVAGKTQFLRSKALLASLVIIVIYVWVRFQSIMFGFAAVLGFDPRRAGDGRLLGAQCLSGAVLRILYSSIRSRSAWRSWPRC